MQLGRGLPRRPDAGLLSGRRNQRQLGLPPQTIVAERTSARGGALTPMNAANAAAGRPPTADVGRVRTTAAAQAIASAASRRSLKSLGESMLAMPSGTR